jgi:hypothetical protein
MHSPPPLPVRTDLLVAAGEDGPEFRAGDLEGDHVDPGKVLLDELCDVLHLGARVGDACMAPTTTPHLEVRVCLLLDDRHGLKKAVMAQVLLTVHEHKGGVGGVASGDEGKHHKHCEP